MIRTSILGELVRGTAILLLAAAIAPLHAAPAQWDSLSIAKIRAVGDYNGTDTTFDNTVEVWIASPPALPGGLVCTVNARVYLNASNKHLMGCIPGDKVASVGRAAPHNMI